MAETVLNLGFWLFVLAFDLLVPLLMVGFGKTFMKNPPTEINPGYGYRTPRSSKNKETWDFAQRRMGEVWHSWGRRMLLPSLLPMLLVLGRDVETVGIVGLAVSGVQLVIMFASFVVIERALRKNFDKNGKRIETD